MDKKQTELLERHINAMEKLSDRLEENTNSMERFIKTHSSLSGILSKTQEMMELKRIKKEVVGGSGGKSLEFAKKLLKKQEKAT